MESPSLPNPCLLYLIQSLLDVRLQLKDTLLPVFFLLYFTSHTIAQSPQQFSCQGVVRDASAHLISNATIGVQITIRQGGAAGANVFQETHSTVTNGAGIFAIEIGTGQTENGSLSAINWEMGPFFIEQAIDLAGGNNYSLTSTTELLSVPYTLYASKVDRANQVAVADTAAGVSNAGLLGLSIGTVMLFAGDDTTVPNGWLLCDSTAYDTTAYSALYSLIGSAYGTAPAGKFRVPDLRGRGPMGFDPNQTEFETLGKTGGSNTHTLTLSELPAHDHGGAQEAGSHRHNVGTRGFFISMTLASVSTKPGGNGSASGFKSTRPNDQTHSHSVSSQGSSNAHNNLQPYYTINFIIKAN
ncbi:phage tail protein [Phaeodactylibacter xiamenensis]|uniref:phage tail protein n=1 Tax=Phaeodactylibacter xiamenensis TaxID=1524460 RepID=UPI0024A98FF6|nr:tail fiber protein [Phaeodactylibacter xiamenensis]